MQIEPRLQPPGPQDTYPARADLLRGPRGPEAPLQPGHGPAQLRPLPRHRAERSAQGLVVLQQDVHQLDLQLHRRLLLEEKTRSENVLLKAAIRGFYCQLFSGIVTLNIFGVGGKLAGLGRVHVREGESKSHQIAFPLALP